MVLCLIAIVLKNSFYFFTQDPKKRVKWKNSTLQLAQGVSLQTDCNASWSSWQFWVVFHTSHLRNRWGRLTCMVHDTQLFEFRKRRVNVRNANTTDPIFWYFLPGCGQSLLGASICILLFFFFLPYCGDSSPFLPPNQALFLFSKC